nr:pleckstrin homology domain-containing family O member 2 [Misgurnus anguillicaudatus]
MEDGVKEETAKPKEVKCAGKAGWLKKSSGKILSSYKDRYVQLDRTVIDIYENEELTTCLEKLDLENYEKCHELKSTFKKKQRLVLIRNPKSGNKVQDVKFQAQTPEEKEEWINAICEGINKAKNKIFDEVKVETSTLEHVTRSRPKGNRERRPPTRIHMKEVANVSNDGILRLDLDGEVIVLNGTHCLNKDGDKETETLKPSVSLNDIAEEEDVNEDTTPQKKVIKPPMPPSKDSKPSDSHKDDGAQSEAPKKILTPPMPPSKENKPRISSVESATDDKVEGENSNSEQTKNVQPPAPPSKHMKPTQPVTQSQETQEDLQEMDDEDMVDAAPDAQKKNEEEDPTFILSNKIIKPQVVMWDSPTTPSKEPPVEQEEQISSKASDDTEKVTTLIEPHQINVTPLATSDSLKKSPGPPAPPKKKPLKTAAKTEEASPQDNLTVLTTPSSEKVSEQSIDKVDIGLTTPEPKPEPGGDISGEDIEEKSLDSGQHSGEESEISEQITASTAKLKGSSQGLDGETSEDDLDPPDSKAEMSEKPSLGAPTTTESSTLNAHPSPSIKSLHITAPLKCSPNARSASLGDLLSENTEKKEIQHESDVKDLQSKVSFEMAETEEMLSEIAAGQSSETDGAATPEILLNAAMEKLRKAEQFLKEARSINKNNRLSL